MSVGGVMVQARCVPGHLLGDSAADFNGFACAGRG